MVEMKTIPLYLAGKEVDSIFIRAETSYHTSDPKVRLGSWHNVYFAGNSS